MVIFFIFFAEVGSGLFGWGRGEGIVNGFDGVCSQGKHLHGKSMHVAEKKNSSDVYSNL